MPRACDRGICGHPEHAPVCEGQLSLDDVHDLLGHPDTERRRGPLFGAVTVTIPGLPVTQGSMKAYGSRVVHDKSTALTAWRDLIGWRVRGLGLALVEPPSGVVLGMTFVLPKPPSTHRLHPVGKPDVDKLVRSVLDALTGVLYRDDSQVLGHAAVKAWYDGTQPPGLVAGGLLLTLARA